MLSKSCVNYTMKEAKPAPDGWGVSRAGQADALEIWRADAWMGGGGASGSGDRDCGTEAGDVTKGRLEHERG